MVATDHVLAALAEPNRRQILDLLSERPRDVGELGEGVGLSQPATSKHLRILREAGLVSVSPAGRRRVYAVRPEPLRDLDAWLAGYRRLWASSLDRLELALDEEEKR